MAWDVLNLWMTAFGGFGVSSIELSAIWRVSKLCKSADWSKREIYAQNINLQDFPVLPWGHAAVARTGWNLPMKQR
jgi:hypothetical protein